MRCLLKPSSFFKRRTVWIPTFLGFCIILFTCLAPFVYWVLEGERILSANHLAPEEILIVDGWIKDEPIMAIRSLANIHKYHYIVATGGYTGEKWTRHRWSYAEIAADSLKKNLLPDNILLIAQAPDSDRHRTYTSACAAKRLIDQYNLAPHSITIYTRGTHAMRSHMVYRKVFGTNVKVGVISWKSPDIDTVPWWRNSSRSEEFFKETFGSLWEWLFDSGR